MVSRDCGKYVKLAEIGKREKPFGYVGGSDDWLKGFREPISVTVALPKTPGENGGIGQLEQVRDFAGSITRRIEY